MYSCVISEPSVPLIIIQERKKRKLPDHKAIEAKRTIGILSKNLKSLQDLWVP